MTGATNKSNINQDRKYVVGAYPASPAHKLWDPAQEKQLFELLSSNERISALEIPWLGSIHPHDDSWLIQNFPRNLQAVITSIPFVMSKVGKDANYGLASSDEIGRSEAIADIKKVLKAVDEFNNSASQSMVSVVEVHTAPRRVANVDALAKSLEEITSWNWSETQLVIEHCDAWVDGQSPEKGFLKLEEEIAAIQQASAPIGIFINWGRSAIELRHAGRVVEHIELAKSSGHLAGLIFSGVASVETDFGYPWIDAHLPFPTNDAFIYGEPSSLLTEGLAHRAISAAGEVSFLGIKMGWPPSLAGDVKQRYEMIATALTLLE
jgi:hypothetical protein